MMYWAIFVRPLSAVILSVVYGDFFWGEKSEPLTWIGGILIILSGLLLVKNRYRIDETTPIQR